jgi:uncharacterized membrane protein
MEEAASTPPPARSSFLHRIRFPSKGRALLLATLAALLIIGWTAAPPGLLGKADAIGYAVCHRIDLRSFHLGDRQLPLCARCTGTFLGAIVGALLLAAFGRGRSSVWPSRGILIALGLTVIGWGLDGLNSYLSLFPRFPHLYPPQNWLRLTTGTFLGMAMAAVYLPAVNQSLWKTAPSDPVLRSWRELFLYFLPAPLLIGLVLTENPILLYPLALLSTLGILFLLSGVYIAVVLMLFKREGRAETWADAWPVIVAGLALALLQLYAIDAVRFSFTHTWGGFTLGG